MGLVLQLTEGWVSPQTAGRLPPGAVGVCEAAPQSNAALVLVPTHWPISKTSPGFRQQPRDDVQKLQEQSEVRSERPVTVMKITIKTLKKLFLL